MDKKQAEQIVSEYLKEIYGFMLKKTGNLQDAEDLAQETVLKLYGRLVVDEIDNVRGYIWRIAHNILANYYRGKSRSSVGIDLNELELWENEDMGEQLIKEETMKHLQDQIAYLSKIQRQIIVLYYFEGKRQEEIGRMLDLPLGTVKWHLFEAKSELKKGMENMRDLSELKFNPIQFTGMGFNGHVGSMGGTAQFFRTTLSQNIAYCVWQEGKTIHEIAKTLGVSPTYIESEVDFLEEYGFLIKQGKKYLANILISEPTSELCEMQSQMYDEAAKLYVNALYEELMKSEWIHYEGLYYPDEDINFLMWAMMVYIPSMGYGISEAKPITFEEVATLRPDGGHNIPCAAVLNIDVKLPKYSECMIGGPWWNEISGLTLWQVDSEYTTSRMDDNYANTAQRDVRLLKRFLEEERLTPEEYAYLAEKGYIKIEGDVHKDFQTSLQIVWIRDMKTRVGLLELDHKIRIKYAAEFESIKANYVKTVLAQTPKHLYKMQKFILQGLFYSDGWFLLHCIKELVGSGKLKLPKENQRKSLSTVLFKSRE